VTTRERSRDDKFDSDFPSFTAIDGVETVKDSSDTLTLRVSSAAGDDTGSERACKVSRPERMRRWEIV